LISFAYLGLGIYDIVLLATGRKSWIGGVNTLT